MSAVAPPLGPRKLAPRLQLVTNRRLCAGRALLGVVAEAAEAGLGAVQLREKDLPGGALLAEARALQRVLGGALLIVNERVDVALAVGAAGVQLPASGLPLAETRRLVGPDVLVGRSVHTLDEARVAVAEGADYLLLGTIFATASKPDVTPGGLDLVRAVTSQVLAPVIAIGGIDERNVAAVIGAGAYGVAVMSAVLCAEAPGRVVARLQEIVAREAAWQ